MSETVEQGPRVRVDAGETIALLDEPGVQAHGGRVRVGLDVRVIPPLEVRLVDRAIVRRLGDDTFDMNMDQYR